jgi:hypothetical protein
LSSTGTIIVEMPATTLHYRLLDQISYPAASTKLCHWYLTCRVAHCSNIDGVGYMSGRYEVCESSMRRKNLRVAEMSSDEVVQAKSDRMSR